MEKLKLKHRGSADQQPGEKRSKPKSGISYPYFDLDSSIKVADAVFQKGGGQTDGAHLAVWLGYSSTRSGTYLTRVSAAKQFGLVDYSKDTITVTELGKTILAPVMPEDMVSAKTQAFLNVELFAKVFAQYNGTQLPKAVGLKHLFENTYKIVPERVPLAVRVFLLAAEQAGFFQASNGDRTRLIKPAATKGAPATESPAPANEETPPPEKRIPGGGSGGGGGEGTGGVHSAIIGLLRELPTPGTPWSAQKKERFLGAFKATIEFIYPEQEAS